MSADPVVDSVFWFTTEYMKGSGWGTHITSFDFSPLQEPTANAGEDVTLCENQLFEANATATSQLGVEWETSGDGIFQNPTLLNTKYLRGNGDLENGSVTLTLTAYGFQPDWFATDEVVLTFAYEPEAMAGDDMTVVAGDVQLEGMAENAASVEWSTQGDGSFNNTGILDPVYSPGTNDLNTGSVTLTLTAFAGDPCGEDDSDNITITFGTTTGMALLKSDDNALRVIPNPSQGQFRVEFNMENAGDFTLRIKNLTGAELHSETEVAEGLVQKSLDLSDWQKGTYLLELRTGKNVVIEKILIK